MQVIDDSFEIFDDQNFIFYQGFFTKDAAEDFNNMLSASNIQSIVEESQYFGERVILGYVNQFPFVLKVVKSDFSKIQDAIQSSLEKQPLSYFENHPLNSLTNNELQKILENTEGEAFETRLTAIKILDIRGAAVINQNVQFLLENTKKAGIKRKEIGKQRLVFTFIMMVSGVLISWIVILITTLIFVEYAFGKSYDDSGIKVLMYDNKTRRLSKVLLLLGLLFNILSINYLNTYKAHLLLSFFNTPFLSTN